MIDQDPSVSDAWAQAQDARQAYVWPKSLRVDQMRGTSGIMERTWSFASPNGCATFEFVRGESAWTCRWQRIGDHSVYERP